MLRSTPLPLGFAAFVGAGLLLERDAGGAGGLALGVLTWLILLGACARLERPRIAAGRERRAPDLVEVVLDHGATLRQAHGAVINRKAESRSSVGAAPGDREGDRLVA